MLEGIYKQNACPLPCGKPLLSLAPSPNLRVRTLEHLAFVQSTRSRVW